ncbi:MAG: ribosomal L7Ae/L30e/S12e/Gadd45 family protein [Candidatus Woesearchaeota archaeon]|nr:ribosomal L7Ae/L30e/S12e/Gadd45 family protein [Candidatus Woesearchaeota archaeon]
MTKRIEDPLGAELKKLLIAKRVIIGTNRTITQARANKLERVLLTKNCPLLIRKQVQQACGATIVCEEIERMNTELGTLCKKPFAISVLGIIR